ncbi:MAG: exonuclease SbcCD subunit D [Acidobacteriota bacterium]|nr:exonuclease SbcCD subunit D [Acidobacteriota bacterium]
MKFLHISDIHLGCTRYQLEESPKDFYRAWIDVLQKYAVGEKVDFVIMAGDFFHKRSVPPETMNHAFAGLSLLKDAGIPVVTIEGNHDQKHNDNEYSWLRSLENWRLIHLLEPRSFEGKFVYDNWDYDSESHVRGGYIDIGNARIFGSAWYGASANWAIPMLTEAIKDNRRDNAFHILMLHTDVEGHQTHPIPALSIANLRELKSVTDYVALGHTHKSYEIDNWAFNPGSLEITSIDDFRETRGAWLVEVGENNEVNARHITDYRQRPFQRLSFDVSGYASAPEITESVLDLVKNQARVPENADEPQPIIEITLRGHLGFPNSLLEQQKIREETQKMTDALHVRIKNHSAPIEYAVAADLEEDASREKLERRVIEDLIIRDNRYKAKAEAMAEAVIGAKRMVLSDEEPEKIVDFIALKLG